MLFRTMDGRRHSLPYSVRGCRAFRRICDALFCDAMSPEFKKANDLLLKIIKMNDRTDGMSYTKLAAIGKAFKENDAKAAKAAYDRMANAVRDGEKNLLDGVQEAKAKLAEAQKNYEAAKTEFAKGRTIAATFDRFIKAIDGLKAKPSGASRLNAYAEKLKAYSDFSKRIASIVAMSAKGKDAGKQVDMLRKSAESAKAKFDKSRAKAEKDLKASADRVSVFKEMDRLRSKKVEEFRKQADDFGKLGTAIPVEKKSAKKGAKGLDEAKQNAMEYADGVVRKAIEKSKSEIAKFGARVMALKSKIEDSIKEAKRGARNSVDAISEIQVINPNMRDEGRRIIRDLEFLLVNGLISKDAVNRADDAMSSYARAAMNSGNKSLQKAGEKLRDHMHELLRPLNDAWQTAEPESVSKILKTNPESFDELSYTEQGNNLIWHVELQKVADSVRKIKDMLSGYNLKLPKGGKFGTDDFENPQAYVEELKKSIKAARRSKE